jgi:hypothetical protein
MVLGENGALYKWIETQEKENGFNLLGCSAGRNWWTL